MATKLLKSVKRELLSSDRKGKAIIVELMPGDVLKFRIKGKKTFDEVYLGHCYILAQIMSMEHIYKEKMKQYKIKKEAGYRVKKVKKPHLPFNKMYFDALSK